MLRLGFYADPHEAPPIHHTSTGMSPMARVNVDRMTLKELLDLEAKLQKAIALARQRERAEVKEELAALAEKRGFTLSELVGGRKGKSVECYCLLKLRFKIKKLRWRVIYQLS